MRGPACSFATEDCAAERLWYAVRAKPSREEEACFHFERQGLICYLPRILVQRSHARKRELVRRPLFPGYLFLHLAPSERRWETIASTRGALCAVHFGEQYPSVPELFIKHLREREDAQGHIVLRGPELRSGQPVAVHLEDEAVLDGIFLEMRGEKRALILVTMLQQQVRTLVPMERLKVS
ncbi:MAG: hypothetical protein BWK76_17450 [Desulfobulbaceae bacterium A2]|nr:MAG: hypothetical protein BWK76_17450 [Desulfobulbaceae bacterium A2]